MKNKGKPFTEKEDEFIRKNCRTMSSVDIGEELGRSPSSIRCRCGTLGVKLGTINGKYGSRMQMINGVFTNPLEDHETLMGVKALSALNVPLNQIAEVICG